MSALAQGRAAEGVAAVAAHDLTRRYGDRIALDAVSLGAPASTRAARSYRRRQIGAAAVSRRSNAPTRVARVLGKPSHLARAHGRPSPADRRVFAHTLS